MNKYMVFVCGDQPRGGMMEYYLDRLQIVEATDEEMAKTIYTVALSGWLRQDEVKYLVAITTDYPVSFMAMRFAREYMKNKGWS